MTRRAYVLVRDLPHYRYGAFCQGLKRAGFKVHGAEFPPRKVLETDLLLVWNRYGEYHEAATRVEAAGGTCLVAENGYLGVDWRGHRWYALAKSHHNGAGWFPEGGHERWDRLGIEIKPQRTGREIVVLPQRGIGPPGVAMPDNWHKVFYRLIKERPARLRMHPGARPCEPLEKDLADAKAVVTWGSGAALRAMLDGVPAYYDMPNWIGAPGATPLAEADFDNTKHGDRLACFRRLMWAQWTVEEIESGEPFDRLTRAV
jgi:hypothetical protein